MKATGMIAALLLAAASPAPQRVVSLNPCLDAILVQVADRGQVAALSAYSRNPAASSLAPGTRGHRFTGATAEEVLSLRPDLVLAPNFGFQPLRSALKRLGIPVQGFGAPSTVEGSVEQVRAVAAAVGRPARGEALVARIRSALAAAAPPPGAPPLSALVFEGEGFVSARGTLTDEMLTRTGFDNAATRYGLIRTGALPLERLIADPPKVLLATPPSPGKPFWAERVLRHPALRTVSARMKREPFPRRLTYCGGPVLIEAAQALAAARRDALEGMR